MILQFTQIVTVICKQHITVNLRITRNIYSITYNRVKWICLTTNEFNKNVSNLLQQLVKEGYHHATFNKQIEKAQVEDRTLLLNKSSREVKRNIPISITYNGTLPYNKSVVEKTLACF